MSAPRTERGSEGIVQPSPPPSISLAFAAMTRDRSKWPPMVGCRRGIFPAACVGHADCRAAYWADRDAEAKQAAGRALARRALASLQPRLTRLDGTPRRAR